MSQSIAIKTPWWSPYMWLKCRWCSLHLYSIFDSLDLISLLHKLYVFWNRQATLYEPSVAWTDFAFAAASSHVQPVNPGLEKGLHCSHMDFTFLITQFIASFIGLGGLCAALKSLLILDACFPSCLRL